MIIDTHTHVGRSPLFDLTSETLLESMRKYGVDFALVSDIRGAETDHQQNLLPGEFQIPQITLLRELIPLVQAHPQNLGALVWIRPLQEQNFQQLRREIQAHRRWIYGLKIHPYHSALSLEDPRMRGYLDLAADLDLAVLVHTATDPHSRPSRVLTAARQYPRVNFILAHLELGSEDCREALELLAQEPNLYGDTAWVKPAVALKALKSGLREKLMFGSDNPIDGLDTYDHPEYCRQYLGPWRESLTAEEDRAFFWETALRVFHLPLL